jgi:uncharacterized membrane protein YbhN (UPF0104 family)
MFSKTDIEKYFNAEKSVSFLFMLIGIAAVITAIGFFIFIKTNFYKGAAIPLLLIGLLLGIIGFTVYKRSDADRIRNVYAYDLNPAELKQKEIPRMQTVMKNFVVYRYVEILLALVGIGFFFYFKNNDALQLWKGFGLTLTIMALLALTADYFAAQRGEVYSKGLQSFIEQKFK